MAILRTDLRPALAVQLSPEEAFAFIDLEAARRPLRASLTAAARNGDEVQILHPDGWPLDIFTVLETGSGKVVTRSGRRLAVLL